MDYLIKLDDDCFFNAEEFLKTDFKNYDYTKQFDVDNIENGKINEYFQSVQNQRVDNFSIDENQQTINEIDLTNVNTTFLHLVTESDIEEHILFVTEKTFRAIYACQPFVILGNTGTLKYLKSLTIQIIN